MRLRKDQKSTKQIKKDVSKRMTQECVQQEGEIVSSTDMKIEMFAEFATGLYIFNFPSGFEDLSIYKTIFNSLVPFQMAM